MGKFTKPETGDPMPVTYDKMDKFFLQVENLVMELAERVKKLELKIADEPVELAAPIKKAKATKPKKPPVKKPPGMLVGPIDDLSHLGLCTELLASVRHDIQFAWIDTYSLRLVKREIPKAYSWLKSNAQRSYKDYPRYLNNWFSKAQANEPQVHEAPKLKVAEEPEIY